MQPNAETGAIEAYIEFENADQVRAAFSKGPTSIAGSEVQLMRCRPKQEVWNFQAEEEPRKIYVSNLSTVMEKKTLREAFSKVRLFLINIFH
jgi:hypothetical protein